MFIYTFGWSNEDLTAFGTDRNVMAPNEIEAGKANAFYELKGYHFRLISVRDATPEEMAAHEEKVLQNYN
jgi:uncharacterized DUF497 family protein